MTQDDSKSINGNHTLCKKMNEFKGQNIFDLPFFNQFTEFVSVNTNKSLQENLHSYVSYQTEACDSNEKQNELILLGIELLKLFIQQNWTGPGISLNEKLQQLNSGESRLNILKYLVVDGENVVSVVEVPELLLFSKSILEIAWSKFKNCEKAKLWFLRSLFIHQQVLEELSPELFEKICLVIEEIKETIGSVSKSTEIANYLEFSRTLMYYSNIQKSKEDIKKATELSGIELSLSGALGKRTKFQAKDLAQLVLKLKIEGNVSLDELADEQNCLKHPKDVKLDDDVRLDKVKYADSEINKFPKLNGLQQAVILGNLFQTQKSQPKDCLADEELQPLISCILDQSVTWSVRMTTLLLRSKLEANHKRTIERSVMQIQVLADAIKDLTIPYEVKFIHFFISYLPPKWEIQSMLANILLSIGSVKSALDIYQSLEDWENIIYCYNTLQMRHKAQEIIEQELKKESTPKLWCLLGDATDDVSCYEKAWELSNKRSARAQRHWALYYYYRKNYAESIEHFQKSLEINSLQKELWYRLGYAALMEEKWEVSAMAYRRYCVLDPECFEAWNNLGRCYCELKQKSRAWRALQEALKVDYSNWKVWDNYMVVSSDLKMYDEVIKSYHEILNLQEKHVDIPVLNSLVLGYKSIKYNEENDSAKIECRKKLKSKILELFGRLTSQVFNEPELWFLYSEVVETDSPENLTKKHQLLLKAHRSFMNKIDWEKKIESCNKVIYVISKLIEVGLLIQKQDILMSCKLAATAALAKIKKEYPDAGICEGLEENLEKLNFLLSS